MPDNVLMGDAGQLVRLGRFWDRHLGLTEGGPKTLWTALDNAINDLTGPGVGYSALHRHVLLMDVEAFAY